MSRNVTVEKELGRLDVEEKEALELKSKSGVHRLISALEERGFIRRLPNRARALEVLKMPESAVAGSTPKAANDLGARTTSVPARIPEAANDVIDIPLHGRIAAGAPIEALEDHQSLPVPAALLGPGEHFALEVSGDSMIEAGIFDGDYALIRRADTAPTYMHMRHICMRWSQGSFCWLPGEKGNPERPDPDAPPSRGGAQALHSRAACASPHQRSQGREARCSSAPVSGPRPCPPMHAS